jgi:hypothetical protein
MVQINCWNRDDCYWKPDSKTGKPTSWHGTKDLDGGTLFTNFLSYRRRNWHSGDATNIMLD